jgi:Ser/Thr protein kinase RdoA (MazF antagonist)
MKTLRVLDSSGDRVLRFDDAEATARSRAEAESLFLQMLASGSTAFKVNRADGKPDEKVTDFPQLENETILVPRVVGG